MAQKVFKVGSSAAMTISKKFLEESGLRIGDKIEVEVEKSGRSFSVTPVRQLSRKDMKVAKLTFDFINRYRSDLENLAKE